MANLLIVYATKHGQSQKIANFLAVDLRAKLHRVTLHDAAEVKNPVVVKDFDFIVVGGSIYRSSFSNLLIKWVAQHAKDLDEKPTAFFIVCLGILQKDPKVQREIHAIENEFFRKTNWWPKSSATFAGAIAYSKYSWILKTIMRSIVRKTGVETQMSLDYEYTDWKQVSKFADHLVDQF